MKLLFLKNPDFVRSQSMSRFADLVIGGMKERGHEVDSITARPYFARLSARSGIQKWLGYIDRFCIFPLASKRVRAALSPDTLVVCLDQALAPWLPYFGRFSRVTHCHDLLSIRAARKEFPDVRVSSSGKLYQRYILHGLRHCRSFICVSDATRQDVERIVCSEPLLSKTVYNALNGAFCPGDQSAARAVVGKLIGALLPDGFLLHVGNNNWYKNRVGVVRIYEAWRERFRRDLPLLLLGQEPAQDLAAAVAGSPFRDSIHLIINPGDDTLLNSYRAAKVLVFPSRAEGFGWPIAEALACGCPVVTTLSAPMTEVGGQSAFYIPVMPWLASEQPLWAAEASEVVQRAAMLSESARGELRANAEFIRTKFSTKSMLEQFENIYAEVLGAISKR